MLAVAGSHQRHHVEAELLFRQSKRTFGLRAVGLVETGASTASQRRIFRRSRAVPANVTNVRWFW